MQDEQPAIVFEDEDVGGICLGALHFIAGRSGDAFQA
jgi:hypothetical protein